MQDFRQSGDIAYEAGTALLIHREIDDETEQPMQDGLIIVAKGRSDAGGAVRVWFNTDALTFTGKHFGVGTTMNQAARAFRVDRAEASD